MGWVEPPVVAMSCWSVCVREEPELLVTVVELVEWWSREMKVRWARVVGLGRDKEHTVV